MFGRARILLTIAACLLATPAAAQAPAPATTAFDGTYVGTAAPQAGGRVQLACGTITSVDMEITGGQVVIHEVLFNGGTPTYRGNVNSAGEVSASREGKSYPEGAGDFLTASGKIEDNAFTGQRVLGQGRLCYFSIQMQKVPAPTMPFDGDYVGVSRESSCLANGVPVTLIIRSSVVMGGSWRGSVNPQGVVVMGNRLSPRVDGQIDGQGIIRAQGSSSVGGGCTITSVWRKQSG